MAENQDGGIDYEFGPYRLMVADYLLSCNGRSISLQPKVFKLLVALVEQRGHTIEKDRLMETLWPNAFVEESSLTQLIFQLRKALGDGASKQQYIETIPKRGYRFVADVTILPRAATEVGINTRVGTHILIDQEEELESELGKTHHGANDTLPNSSNEPESAVDSAEPTQRTAEPDQTAAGFTTKTLKLMVAGAATLGLVLIIAIGANWFLDVRTGANTNHFERMNYRKLTASGKAILPAVSPDGNYAAYVLDDSGRQVIWVRQVGTISRVQITQPAEVEYRGLTFSHDGLSLYYVEAQRNQPRGVLYRVPVLGGMARSVMTEVDSPITFSPDGKRFAFLRGSQMARKQELMVANADGTNLNTLATRKKPEYYSVLGPAWSPDGSVIACGAGTLGPQHSYRQVVTVSVNDGKETPLGSQTWARIGQVAWLGGGSGVVINAWPQDSPAFTNQLWYLAYPSGDARKLSRDLSSYEGVSIAAHSDLIAVARSDRVSRIWVAPTTQIIDARQIKSSTGDNYSETFGLAWTFSGKIAYSSRASGNADIWLMDADGGNQRQLTFDTLRETWPAVSSDDRYVVFSAEGRDGAHIWRINADGSNRQRLTHGKGERHPNISPDGRWVHFTSMDLGWPAVGRVSIDGGETKLLTHDRSAVPVVSPDGKTVACLYFDESALRWMVTLIPLQGGDPKLLNDVPAPDWFLLQWTPDGRGLAYITSRDGASNIWVQPIAGGPPEKLTDFKTDRIYRFAWSRDGNHIALERGVDIADIILISDFR
jgi:Tol biopolymer transport system component/DNA-binding winged helix-turn-helix (wHTH) protein